MKQLADGLHAAVQWWAAGKQAHVRAPMMNGAAAAAGMRKRETRNEKRRPERETPQTPTETTHSRALSALEAPKALL